MKAGILLKMAQYRTIMWSLEPRGMAGNVGCRPKCGVESTRRCCRGRGFCDCYYK